MKTAEQRGPTAVALRSARLRAGFTNQREAAAHVRRETGVVGLTDSQYASYEAGDPDRPLSAKHRAAIESVFGPLDDAPDEQRGGALTTDLTPLLKAMAEQTAAIHRLAAALEAQADPSEMAEVVARSVLAALQAAGVSGASPERHGSDAPQPGKAG